MILITSFISSFEKNRISPGKLSLAKGIAIFASAFLLKLANQGTKDPPD